MGFAKNARLNDTEAAQTYRSKYQIPGKQPPSIVACDGVTSDNFYSSNTIAGAFGDYVSVLTNGTGKYCATAEEDSAMTEVLPRGAEASVVDFGRINHHRHANRR